MSFVFNTFECLLNVDVTDLNAMTRGIELCLKILASTTVGLIMTYVSILASAVLIAVWNIVSVFIEYSLLYKVYRLVPALAIKREGPTLAEVEGGMSGLSALLSLRKRLPQCALSHYISTYSSNSSSRGLLTIVSHVIKILSIKSLLSML